MKKIFITLFATLFLIPVILFAQVAKTGNNVSLSAPGNGTLDIFTSGTGNINFGTNGTRRFSVDSSGVLDLAAAGKFSTLTYGAAATIRSTTADGADDLSLSICGGGACSTDGSRGANLFLPGEQAGAVDIQLDSGTAAGTDIYIQNNNSSDGTIQFYVGGGQAWVIQNNGVLVGQANSGDIQLSKSGTTLMVDSGTGASACAGVATPNGTTNVTVTTSCAVSGARVFLSRTGATTNMGFVSTVTAPNGTSFQFVSSNVADTLASSVWWWIQKEG